MQKTFINYGTHENNSLVLSSLSYTYLTFNVQLLRHMHYYRLLGLPL